MALLLFHLSWFLENTQNAVFVNYNSKIFFLFKKIFSTGLSIYSKWFKMLAIIIIQYLLNILY